MPGLAHTKRKISNLIFFARKKTQTNTNKKTHTKQCIANNPCNTMFVKWKN